jgi:tRNA-dihydrouridine synthase B
LSQINSSSLPASGLPIQQDQPWLAPLAGFSDLPFRLLCRDYGCGAAFTEMISAKGLVYQTRNTLELLKTCAQDSPLIVQLYGSEPKVIRQSMSILLDQGFCFFDLNCGCPVKKVVKTGSGAALLKNSDLIVEMAWIMSEAAGQGRAGIKIRLGWNRDSPVYLDLAEKLSNSGIGWITLHPRTAVQFFSGKATWDALTGLKKATQIPIIASGDLFTAQDAMDCVCQTNVDCVMFARGALNNPFVFEQYRSLWRKPSTADSHHFHLGDMCLKTIEYYQKYYPSHKAILKMRTVLPRMIREIPGARELRKEIIMSKDWENIRKAVAGI